MGEKPPIPIDGGPELQDRGMARVARLHLVDVAHHRHDRPTSGTRQKVTSVFVDGQALAAEIAADERGVDDNPVGRNAQPRRELPAELSRRLIGIDDVNAILLIDPHDARAWLKKSLELARYRERVLEHVVRACEDLLNGLAGLGLL